MSEKFGRARELGSLRTPYSLFFAFFPQTELEKVRAISEKVFLEFQLSWGGGRCCGWLYTNNQNS